MGDPFWRELWALSERAWPDILVLLVALGAAIRWRRRLGRAAPLAIGGLAVMAAARIGGVLWPASVVRVLNARPDGWSPSRAFLDAVDVALLVVRAVGLALVCAAVFAGRRSEGEP